MYIRVSTALPDRTLPVRCGLKSTSKCIMSSASTTQTLKLFRLLVGLIQLLIGAQRFFDLQVSEALRESGAPTTAQPCVWQGQM